MNHPAIELNQMSFSHGAIPILENATFSAASGEFIGIFGPNGGGKTTLLKLLMGFLPPERGLISIYGEPPEKNRHRIGYVPQIHRTDPDFPITLKELIVMGRSPKRLFFKGHSNEDWEACEFWMDRLGLTEHRNKAYGKLSGGLAQRALLARSLISDPDLILLDEPTSNIDTRSLAILLETLSELKGRKTILLVTHDLRTLVQKADRLLCIQGTITSLDPSEVCGHYALGLYHAPLEARELEGVRA
jgi:zinc transport system ATP-binding protein